jgi:hypothetical protein
MVGSNLRRRSFGLRPWHGHPRVFLARRGRDDEISVLELAAVNRKHVLDHQVGIVEAIETEFPTHVFDVKTYGGPPFGDQTLRPPE